MKRRILSVFSLFILLLTSFLLVRVGLSVVQSSPLRQFNISYENSSALNFTTLNYTNSYRVNISAFANSSYTTITLEVLNDTTSFPDSGLSQNYSQGDTRTICTRIPLQVLLYNGTYNNVTDVTNSTSQNITLIHSHSECSPGRYYTAKLTLRNTTWTNESANLTIYLDIPISASNALNTQTGNARFNGSLPLNATTYHSYYFNATWTNSTNENLVANATGFVINLTSSADTDVFVVNGSGFIKAKSINKSYNNESLIYGPLPTTPEMWEIRVFGNSTSTITYNGNLIFTTLNSSVNNSLNFGVLNSTTNKTINYALKNEGNLSAHNLREIKELYHIQRFSGNNANGNTNYSFFVPDSSVVSRVKVKLNWTGEGNYTLNIRDSTGSIVVTSVNKHRLANVSKVDQEEYNETTNSLTNGGYWKAEVVNSTNITGVASEYNVTVYLYPDTSSWVATNFSNISLNTVGNTNSTSNITLNLTVPSLSLNGTYEGSIKYLDRNNAGISIPINFEITTGMLLVNNTLSKDTSYEIFVLNESYGYNRTRSIFFNISNLGFNTLNLSFVSSPNMTCYSGSCSGYNASFVFNSTNQTLVSKNSFTTVNVTITYNSSLPTSTIYSGWIYANSTNDSVSDYSNRSSHPYPGVYINFRLNLTNYVDVRILNIKSEDYSDNVVNSSKPENITIALDVYAINGTDKYTDLLFGNFTGVWLQERNVTSIFGRKPATGNLSFYAATTPLYCTSGCPSFSGNNHYYLNTTIPTNTTGGIYNVYVNVTDVGSYDSAGIGTNTSVPIVVNNSGLTMSSMNGTSLSMSNSSSYVLAVNVTNYGPIAPSARGETATITLTESCSGYSVSSPTYSNCPSTSFDPAGYNSSCVVRWTITTGSTNASACTAYISGTPTNMWFDPNEVNVSVSVSVSTGTTSPSNAASNSAQTTTTTTAYTSNLTFTDPPSIVYVMQNSTNTTSVAVKNNGRRNQNVTLTIDSLSSSVWSVTTVNQYVAVSESATFTIKFNSTNLDSIDYPGKFKVTSSDVAVTSDFKLRVLPNLVKQQEINKTYEQYKLNLTELSKQINQTKAQGVNVSAAESDYLLLKVKMDQVGQYIKQSNYFDAYQSFGEIKSLFDKIKNELTAAKESKGGILGLGKVFGLKNPYIIFGIVGALIGGGVLAYLFWPTKTPTPGLKTETVKPQPKKPEESILFKSKEGAENIWNKLKEKWSGLRGSKEKKVEYKGS